MLEITSSTKEVLAEFLTPILPKIVGEPTIEALIELHQFIRVKCGVSGIKTWRSLSRITWAKNFIGGLYGTDRLRVCATTQHLRLPTNYRYRPRANAQNRTVTTKPSTFQNMHRHGRSTEKPGRHGGTTSLPVPTGGLIGEFWTGDHVPNAPAYFQLLRGERKNWPQGKCGKDDGAIQPRGTPSPFNREII